MTISAGSRLGPYEIVSPLGAGGMGEVYKARDTRLDRSVAIKILPDLLAADPQFRERFDREARAISQLMHPHICTVYDVGDQQGTAYLVIQYMAPEQIEGQEADARTDLFAFAAVLYEMITGKKAFEGKSHASLIGAIMHSEPAPISTIEPLMPPLLDHILKRCLAKDPDERWQSAKDLHDALTWIADPRSDPAPSSRASSGRRASRLTWVLVAVATL